MGSRSIADRSLQEYSVLLDSSVRCCGYDVCPNLPACPPYLQDKQKKAQNSGDGGDSKPFFLKSSDKKKLALVAK